MSDLSMGFDDLIGSAPASFAAADQSALPQKSPTSFFKKITARHLLFIAALLALCYVLYRYWPRKQPVVKTEDELLAHEAARSGSGSNQEDPLTEAHRVVDRNMRRAKPATSAGVAKKSDEEEVGEEDDLSKPTGVTPKPQNTSNPHANARLVQSGQNLQPANAPNLIPQNLLQSQVYPPPELNLGVIAANGGMTAPLAEMMEKVQLKQKVETLTTQIAECKQGVADTNKGLRAVRGLIQESHNIIVQQIQQHINLQQQQFQHLQYQQQQQQQQQSMRRAEPTFYPTMFPSPTVPPLSPFINSPQAAAAVEAATAEYREQQKVMREVQKERNRGREREVERRGDDGDKPRERGGKEEHDKDRRH